MNTHKHTHTHLHAHTHTHTHIHTHTHTHTHTHETCEYTAPPMSLAFMGSLWQRSLQKIPGLFCKRALQKDGSFSNGSYRFRETTCHSFHPIHTRLQYSHINTHTNLRLMESKAVAQIMCILVLPWNPFGSSHNLIFSCPDTNEILFDPHTNDMPVHPRPHTPITHSNYTVPPTCLGICKPYQVCLVHFTCMYIYMCVCIHTPQTHIYKQARPHTRKRV